MTFARHTRSFCESPHDVVVHRHEDDSSFEFFWFTIQVLQYFLDLKENVQRCVSWIHPPLELHWFSIDSIQFSAWTIPIWLSIHRLIEGTDRLSQDTIQSLRIRKLLPSRDWLYLRRSSGAVFLMEKPSDLFLTLLRFPVFVLESVSVSHRFSSVFLMACRFCGVISSKKDGCAYWRSHEYSPRKRMRLNVIHIVTWWTI